MRVGRDKEFAGRSGDIASPNPAGHPVSGKQDVVDHARLKAYREALDRVAIVAATDMRGKISEVNQRFCAISGYEREELIGRTHNLVNSGLHPRSFFDDMWKTISTGRVWRGDICNRAKCGHLYWVDTTIAPQRDALGRLQGYVSIRFDISDRKAAEERAHLELLRRQDSEALLAGFIKTSPDDVAKSGPGTGSSQASECNPSGRQ